MRVLAEGVETEAQRKRLAEVGCNELQGYLISKPITADEGDRLLAPGGRSAMAAWGRSSALSRHLGLRALVSNLNAKPAFARFASLR